MIDKDVRDAIESFIVDTDILYNTHKVFAGNEIDPPEYMDYCKICNTQEREHSLDCLFYPLFMAI